MWFTVDDACQFPFFDGTPDSDNFTLTSEGYRLMKQWLAVCYPLDKTISGVLADWLEENKQDVLGPNYTVANANRLDRFITNLRIKCFSTEINIYRVYDQ